MIDHTRAFRSRNTLLNPKVLKQCDRQLLTAMKRLTLEDLKAQLGKYLFDNEIKALLARRDKLVQFFDNAGSSALYDLLPAK